MATIDTETATILRYALPQMEAEREALTKSIARVRTQLGMDGKPAEDGLPATANGFHHVVAAPSEEHHQVAAPPARKPAPFSAAARKRMAAAQKLRWDNYHKQKRAAK